MQFKSSNCFYISDSTERRKLGNLKSKRSANGKPNIQWREEEWMNLDSHCLFLMEGEKTIGYLVSDQLKPASQKECNAIETINTTELVSLDLTT